MKKPMKKMAKGKPAKAKGKMPAFLEKKIGFLMIMFLGNCTL